MGPISAIRSGSTKKDIEDIIREKALKEGCRELGQVYLKR